MVWTNNDGLLVKFGTEEAELGAGGHVKTMGALDVIEVEILLTDLTTTAAVVDQHIVVPSSSRIEKIEVVSETAATSGVAVGGSATLDIGLVRLDRSTELDHDGFVAALALSSINVSGELNTLAPGVTSAGALVGTTLANPGVITARYAVAAYTAGKVVVRVHFYRP